MEKIAFYMDESNNFHGTKIFIDEESIEQFIGSPIFSSKKIYPVWQPPGVVTGLAYNAYGGSILYIEATQASYPDQLQSRGSLKVTGSLGEVMKESSSIAQTYARNFL
jgi:ATP-dependent Lon protease